MPLSASGTLLARSTRPSQPSQRTEYQMTANSLWRWRQMACIVPHPPVGWTSKLDSSSLKTVARNSWCAVHCISTSLWTCMRPMCIITWTHATRHMHMRMLPGPCRGCFSLSRRQSRHCRGIRDPPARPSSVWQVNPPWATAEQIAAMRAPLASTFDRYHNRWNHRV